MSQVPGASSGLHPSSGARGAILLLALGAFVSGVSLRCVEPMLPQLAADFSTSVSAASIIVTAFAVAYACAVLVQGPLGDRYGKLRVVTIGVALAGLAAFGCAAAWNLGSLAGLRFLMAIFASAPVALGIAYIGDVVPLEDRQATIARFIAGSIFGQTLGPLFGGVVTDWAGWRASFAALGALFIASAAITFLRTRRDWPPVQPGRFRPLATHARLLSRAPVRWLVAVGVAETFFFFGGYVFLGAYLRDRFDLSYTAIGLVLAGYGVGGLAYSSLVRWFLPLGDRRLVVLGGVLGFLFFCAIVLAGDWRYAVPSTFGLGLAFYLIHNTIQTKASEVAPDARGSAIALYASAWAVGQAAGVAAIGIAVAWTGYVPAILAAALGFALLGLWLRYNIARLHA
jgi:MFS transporter, YNFM family, putative membrane transport protein